MATSHGFRADKNSVKVEIESCCFLNKIEKSLFNIVCFFTLYYVNQGNDCLLWCTGKG